MGLAILIAHGDPFDKFHDRIFELVGRGARGAYVGAANGDSQRWFARVAEALARRHDARLELVRTVGVDDGAAARAQIAAADFVYLAGGDVSVLAERLHALELAPAIRARHDAGALVVGVSAGAIGLAPSWIEFPDDRAPYRFPCAGAIPFAIDCHDEESDWEELRALLERWAADEPDAIVDGYGIPAGGALEVDARGVVRALGAPLFHVRLERGRVTEVDHA
jgi:hypothetical protein